MQKLNIHYLLFKNRLYNAVQCVQIVPFAITISPWSTNFFFKIWMNICSTVLFLFTSGRGPAVWSCSGPGMWLELKAWDMWMRKGVPWRRLHASLSPPLGLTMDGGLAWSGALSPTPPETKQKSHQTTWHKPVSAQEKGPGLWWQGCCTWRWGVPAVVLEAGSAWLCPRIPRALLPSLPEPSSWTRRD